MKTNCARCTKEIEDDDVTNCEDCGLDGICDNCMGDHECETEEDDDDE